MLILILLTKLTSLPYGSAAQGTDLTTYCCDSSNNHGKMQSPQTLKKLTFRMLHPTQLVHRVHCTPCPSIHDPPYTMPATVSTLSNRTQFALGTDHHTEYFDCCHQFLHLDLSYQVSILPFSYHLVRKVRRELRNHVLSYHPTHGTMVLV